MIVHVHVLVLDHVPKLCFNLNQLIIIMRYSLYGLFFLNVSLQTILHVCYVSIYMHSFMYWLFLQLQL